MKACACKSMLRARPFGLVCCARSGNGWLTPLAGPTEGRRLASCHKSRSRRRGSPTSRLGVGHFDGDAAVLFSLIAVCVCVFATVSDGVVVNQGTSRESSEMTAAANEGTQLQIHYLPSVYEPLCCLIHQAIFCISFECLVPVRPEGGNIGTAYEDEHHSPESVQCLFELIN